MRSEDKMSAEFNALIQLFGLLLDGAIQSGQDQTFYQKSLQEMANDVSEPEYSRAIFNAVLLAMLRRNETGRRQPSLRALDGGKSLDDE